MVTYQSSELGWEVTVELPADFLSLGRGSVNKTKLIPYLTNFCFFTSSIPSLSKFGNIVPPNLFLSLY